MEADKASFFLLLYSNHLKIPTHILIVGHHHRTIHQMRQASKKSSCRAFITFYQNHQHQALERMPQNVSHRSLDKLTKNS